jgi:hypothetical protein
MDICNINEEKNIDCWLTYLKNGQVVFFLKCVLNVECMQRAGVRGHVPISRCCPCQRALNLQIALNFPHDQRE